MIGFFKNLFGKIQKFIWFIIRKVVLPVSLLTVYIFGIGITRLILMVFDRKQIRKYNREQETYWIKAKDYSADINDCIRQS